MKVICDRGALLEAVNLVSGVVAARTPRAQLGGVKLTATSEGGAGELVLAATDAEISLSLRTTRVDVSDPGEALIPADKLRQIISAEDNEPTLTIETEQTICHIRGEDAHFQVYGYDPADFPPIASFASVVAGGERGAKAVVSHQASQLDAMISRTLFATARENSRYAINGVLLKRDGKRLEMVATDGRRLALARSSISGGSKDDAVITCIVPSKALSMVQKLIEDPDEIVKFAITDNQILFCFGAGENDPEGRAVLTSNLVEGTFPPYEDVIPKDHDKRVVFDRDVFSSAVRRAALLTNEESRGVRMSFKSGDKRVELASRAPEMGEAEIIAEVLSYEGDDLEIGFNPTFIAEPLKVITDPEVIFELKDASKQGIIKSGSDFTYVVMPVNLQ
jgi:DNA polymerase-3 subunit beta